MVDFAEGFPSLGLVFTGAGCAFQFRSFSFFIVTSGFGWTARSTFVLANAAVRHQHWQLPAWPASREQQYDARSGHDSGALDLPLTLCDHRQSQARRRCAAVI